MSKDYRIICGGSGSGKSSDDPHSLHLNLWEGGGNDNVHLHIGDLHQSLYRDIPQQFFDLLEIAAYVYCADQALKRTQQDTNSFGDEWRRGLHFTIPVRVIDLWNDEKIKRALTDVLAFVSDEEFTFNFERAKNAPHVQRYLNFSSDANASCDFKRVVMFSGGLDSLAGVIDETLINKDRVVLVTHEPTSKNARLTRELQQLLAEKTGSLRPLHIHVRANKEKALNKEYTQRTRSFLFAAFGVTVAKMMGLDSLRFYENGVVSLNLPVSAQVLGSRATRTTHPRTLAGFQQLFTLLGGTSFTVENPFLWMTKADVVEKIVKASCGELIAASTSCAHTWERTKEYTHCGTCSQCIDRRLAIASVGAERFDPAKHYRRNIFVADRPADDDKMMLAAYLARADELNKISDIAGFIEIFPEIVGAFPFIPGGANKVASQLFDLYKRHGREVNIALTSTIKSYSNYLVDGTLGGGCLLWTLVRKGESNSVSKSPAKLESNHVLYRGADWVITYNGLDVSVKNILGMHYLAFLLRHPGTEVSHSDIYSAVFPPDDPTAVTEILKSGITKGIPMVDTKTIEDVKSAIPDCLAKKDAMQSAGNFKGVEILEEQIDRLQNYLAAVCKKGGGSRVVKGRHQAMRVSVLNALKLAKKKIGATERGRTLLDHLKSSIQPGSPGHLVYKPPQSVDWTFEIPTKNGL